MFKPKTEWVVVEQEKIPAMEIFFKYLLPLTVFAMVMAFLDYGIIGHWDSSLSSKIIYGSIYAVIYGATIIGSVLLSSVLIDVFAKVFGFEKNPNRSFTIVVYAFTPICIGTIFFIIPFMTWLYYLVCLYGCACVFFGHFFTLVSDVKGKRLGYASVGAGVFYAVYWTLYVILKISLTATILSSLYYSL